MENCSLSRQQKCNSHKAAEVEFNANIADIKSFTWPLLNYTKYSITNNSLGFNYGSSLETKRSLAQLYNASLRLETVGLLGDLITVRLIRQAPTIS